jgi:hypothetical protein
VDDPGSPTPTGSTAAGLPTGYRHVQRTRMPLLDGKASIALIGQGKLKQTSVVLKLECLTEY